MAGSARRTVDGPVRVGKTVRRPSSQRSAFVEALLLHLERSGASWSPRALGFDESGREMVSWIEGAPASDEQVLDALASVVRELHDLTTGLVDDAECVIHDDLQPRNVVVQNGRLVGLIDWEQARPGRRVEDVANLCWSFVEPTPASDATEIGQRWRQIVDAYGLDDREAVVDTVLTRMATCVTDIERCAAAGSTRHQALAERGDHLHIRAMRSWTIANERVLARIITEG